MLRPRKKKLLKIIVVQPFESDLPDFVEAKDDKSKIYLKQSEIFNHLHVFCYPLHRAK
jgi:hypothetical protein